MMDNSDIVGPVIKWLDYGYEGWRPSSHPSIKAALMAETYGNRFIITRRVDFDVIEAPQVMEKAIT